MAMKFVPGTKIVHWDEDPKVTELKRASASAWRSYQEAMADTWQRNVQQLKATGGRDVQQARALTAQLAQRLKVILTPAERAQVKATTVPSLMKRYPLNAPPAIAMKIYSDPEIKRLVEQLGRLIT
jgi:hypothetical protein